MVKRIFTILIVMILLIMSSPIAYADAVFSNEFLYQHKDETLNIGRSRFIGGWVRWNTAGQRE